jgi:hypothetical protein
LDLKVVFVVILAWKHQLIFTVEDIIFCEIKGQQKITVDIPLKPSKKAKIITILTVQNINLRISKKAKIKDKMQAEFIIVYTCPRREGGK